jgi:hypothetical protein
LQGTGQQRSYSWYGIKQSGIRQERLSTRHSKSTATELNKLDVVMRKYTFIDYYQTMLKGLSQPMDKYS